VSSTILHPSQPAPFKINNLPLHPPALVFFQFYNTEHTTKSITFRKMSVVSLLGVNVLNNPAKFGDPYEFEITFECLEPLQKGI
jgi:hypothetical protein